MKNNNKEGKIPYKVWKIVKVYLDSFSKKPWLDSDGVGAQYPNYYLIKINKKHHFL